MRLSRSTGAGIGALVVLLALWTGFIPFVGPYFGYGFSPDVTWHFTLDRLWLNILPAAAAFVGGMLMIAAIRRKSGLLGALLALTAGVWLLVGPSLSLFWHHPEAGTLLSGIGTPFGGHYRTALEMVGFFYAPGALITMLATFAIGRFMRRPALVPVPAGAGAREDEVTADRIEEQQATAVSRPTAQV